MKIPLEKRRKNKSFFLRFFVYTYKKTFGGKKHDV